MNRQEASESIAEAGEGVSDPERVHSIADNQNDPDKVGFMYHGDEYGESAWILCDTEDLVTDSF